MLEKRYRRNDLDMYSCYKRECCSHRNRDTLLSKERRRKEKKKIINSKDNVEKVEKVRVRCATV